MDVRVRKRLVARYGSSFRKAVVVRKRARARLGSNGFASRDQRERAVLQLHVRLDRARSDEPLHEYAAPHSVRRHREMSGGFGAEGSQQRAGNGKLRHHEVSVGFGAAHATITPPLINKQETSTSKTHIDIDTSKNHNITLCNCSTHDQYDKSDLII